MPNTPPIRDDLMFDLLRGVRRRKTVFSNSQGRGWLLKITSVPMTLFLFAFGFLLLLLPRANAVATNDNFNQRATLFGDRLTVTASSVGATRAPNEPAMAGVDSGASLWWVWRPTLEGRAVVDTTGSSFDTVLGIYFGKEIGRLDNRWGANDSDGGNLTSRIEFNADPSVDHSIVVAGKNSAAGDIVLNIRLYTLPVIVESPKDLEVTSGQSADFRVRALGTHPSPKESLPRIEISSADWASCRFPSLRRCRGHLGAVDFIPDHRL